jgi:hypothetical protein
MAEDGDEILTRAELGRKFVIALESVNNPQALMQAISDRSSATLRGELMVHIEGIKQAIEVAHANLVRVPTDVQKAIAATEDVFDAKYVTLSEVDAHSTRERELILAHLNENLRNTRESLQLELAGNKQLYMEKFTAIEETIKVLKETINDRFTQNDANTEKAFNAAKQAVAERDASNAASANKSEKNLMDAIGKLDDNVKTLSGTSALQISSNKSTLDDKITDVKALIAGLDNRISSGESTKRGSGETVVWLFGGLSLLIGLGGFIVAAIALAHTH